MGIIWTVIIGFVAGVIAKLITLENVIHGARYFHCYRIGDRDAFNRNQQAQFALG